MGHGDGGVTGDDGALGQAVLTLVALVVAVLIVVLALAGLL